MPYHREEAFKFQVWLHRKYDANYSEVKWVVKVNIINSLCLRELGEMLIKLRRITWTLDAIPLRRSHQNFRWGYIGNMVRTTVKKNGWLKSTSSTSYNR